jgi:hypothetical protein
MLRSLPGLRVLAGHSGEWAQVAVIEFHIGMVARTWKLDADAMTFPLSGQYLQWYVAL